MQAPTRNKPVRYIIALVLGFKGNLVYNLVKERVVTTMASIQRSCLVDEIAFTCFRGFTALGLLVLVESCDLARVILGITVGPKVGVALTTGSQLIRFVAGHASAKTLGFEPPPRAPFDNRPSCSCHNFLQRIALQCRFAVLSLPLMPSRDLRL